MGSATLAVTTNPAPATAAATAAAGVLSAVLSAAALLSVALITALSAGIGARFVQAGGAVPGAPSPKMSAVTAAVVTSSSAIE